MILGAKYGEAYTLRFPLIEANGTAFETGATFAAGDTQISKNEGSFANTTNTPTHVGNGIYSLALTAAEMQAARVTVTIIDSATKVWEDQCIPVDTYGDASAQHAFDLDSATVEVDSTQVSDLSAAACNKLADHILRRTTSGAESSSDGDSVSLKSLLGAISVLTHRISTSTNAMTIYRSDNATTLGSRSISSDPNAKPITGIE